MSTDKLAQRKKLLFLVGGGGGAPTVPWSETKRSSDTHIRLRSKDLVEMHLIQPHISRMKRMCEVKVRPNFKMTRLHV